MMFELEGDAFERDEAPSCVPPCIQSHSRFAPPHSSTPSVDSASKPGCLCSLARLPYRTVIPDGVSGIPASTNCPHENRSRSRWSASRSISARTPSSNFWTSTWGS